MDIRYQFQAARQELAKASRALVVCHQRPDGDALGSSAAILNFLDTLGIGGVGFCVDPVPDQYGYLPGVERFTSDPAVFADRSFDLLVVCDTGDLKHAGIAELVAASPRRQIVVFDHHHTNERYGDVNVIDPQASSCAEVVYRFLNEVGAEIDGNLATCLLAGIFTDTDSFSNPATSDVALEAASDLLRRGANFQAVTARFVHDKSVGTLRLWGQILSRLKHHDELGIASTAVFEADGAEAAQIEGIANFLSAFLDAKVVLVLKEVSGGLVKGSFRTVEDVDVSAVCKALGGGGHRKAAGFSVPGRICEGTDCWRIERI